MTAVPELSVIIAVCNGAATIGATLDSLRAQEFSGWEAVIVNDGSTDRTARILTKAAAQDARLRVVTVANGGVSLARNIGLEMAHAERVLFLDADDALAPGHLGALCAAARRDPAADIHCLDWRVVGRNGQEGAVQRVTFDPSAFAALASRCPFPVHAALSRREMIHIAGRFDPGQTVCEDWDLWQRLARIGAGFRRVPGAVARYTLRPGSASRDLGAFLTNGLAVIRRGHGPDPRVTGERVLAPMPAPQAPAAEVALAVWLAGHALGAGQDAAMLLKSASFRVPAQPDPLALAEALLDGMARGTCEVQPGWPALWTAGEPAVRKVMARIESASHMAGLAAISLTHAERLLTRRMPAGTTARIGNTAVVTFDLDQPATRHIAATDRLIGIVARGGREVGRFECFAAEAADPVTLAAMLADFQDAPPILAAATGTALPGENEDDPAYWEAIFAAEDPWDYENPYEALKYEQTLAAMPCRVGRALELACAEGFFTRRLVTKADHVLATDISAIAVARARQRLAGAGNADFAVLDFLRDPLPTDLDLIICSEVLYYLPDRKRLDRLALKIAAALKPGGHLLMTHANLIADAPDQTGFDWPHEMGARTIAEGFSAVPELDLVTTRAAEMYRIELFRKSDGSPPPIPHVEAIPHATDIPPEVAHHLRWADAKPATPQRMPEGVPVLMYHRVTDAPVPALAQWAVSPTSFRAQMQWLATNGFTVISLAAFEDAVWLGTPLPDRPVLITFDDGYCDARQNAMPVLRDLGMTATVFLPTGYIGKTASWDSHFGPPAPLMDWDEIVDLSARGITFAAHSHSHLPLTSLPFARVKSELSRPSEAIHRHLGHSVAALAYPYGAQDEAVQRAAFASGYKLAFTTEHRRWRRGDRAMAIPRLEVSGGLQLEGFARLVTD